MHVLEYRTGNESYLFVGTPRLISNAVNDHKRQGVIPMSFGLEGMVEAVPVLSFSNNGERVIDGKDLTDVALEFSAEGYARFEQACDRLNGAHKGMYDVPVNDKTRAVLPIQIIELLKGYREARKRTSSERDRSSDARVIAVPVIEETFGERIKNLASNVATSLWDYVRRK